MLLCHRSRKTLRGAQDIWTLAWTPLLPVFVLCLVAIGAVGRPASAADQPTASRDGELPTDANGKPLNFDFESGDLRDWEVAGDAFRKQPVEGDTVHPRRGDMRSNHAGKWWVGGYEHGAFDPPQGMLVSKSFPIKQPFASFLVGGGVAAATRVELVADGKVVFQASGRDREDMLPVVVDLTPWLGQQLQIRVIDQSSGPWGHVNFDDFRVHATKPNVANAVADKPAQPAADQYSHAGLEPEAAARAMTVPPGFRVTLFAGEPDVQQPIAMAFDDRGRLWVAEAYSYPIRVPEELAKDRILIFEDSDGDGHFDSRKVFTDKLNLVSGMELGFGGVWVGSAPNLLFIPDADGNDEPDGPPQILLDGWGYQDTHETLNTFNWGPDGWLYGCHGVFTHSRVGKPGAPDAERVPINAGIWRYHPTRHVFEVFAEGTSNPWGIDFNDRGQAFETACVIPHLYHVIQGGRYERQAGSHFNAFTYEDIKTIAKHRHWAGDGGPHSGNGRSDSAGGGHAHAGAMIYLGGSWPSEYRDQIFMNNIHGARLNQDRLEPQGSGYVGDRAPDFLFAHDSWSQILNLQYGPDGQVTMIDWYDRNQCHHGNVPGHDRSNGRIFKISYENARPVQADLNLKKLNDAELIALMMTHPNEWYARHGRRILQERGRAPQLDEPLRKIAFSQPEEPRRDPKPIPIVMHADEPRRLRALWTLHAVQGLDVAAIRQGLENDSPLVRAWTVQLACETEPPTQEIRDKFAQLAASDPSPVVRLYLASACQRLPLADQVAILSGLLSHAEDAGDHNLPLMDWYATEMVASADSSAALSLWPKIKLEKVRSFLVRRLAQPANPAMLATLLTDLLSPATDPNEQLLILRAMNLALAPNRALTMPEGWTTLYTRLANSPSSDVRSESMSLALTFGDPVAVAARLEQLQDPSAATSERVKALTSLLKLRPPQLGPVLKTLVATPGLSGPAIRGLAAYNEPGVDELLLSIYSGLGQQERRDALGTLASRAPWALALLAAVERGEIPPTEIAADLARQLRNLKNPQVDAVLAKVWGSYNESSEERVKQIANYRRMLSSSPSESATPDLSLGRAVFTKTCLQCHTLFGVGAKVGPELTGSNRANLDYLLSNILDPSAVIGKDYLAQVIVTNDGRTLTGLVRDEDATSLKLITSNETLVLSKADIEERSTSTKSMMPEEILKPLSEKETRSLVAYLASPAQVPMLATADNAKTLFNGRDLTGWRGAAELWSVDNGELVGRTSGLNHNEFLFSDLTADDFLLAVDVRLVENRGNSGIQFRSQEQPGGGVRGDQADIGAGWWGKLYEEEGRGLLWPNSGESFVKPGEWNHYEIEAHGSHVRTWINGQLCVDLDDPPGARRGIFALQLHSGGPTEVRFKNFKLEVGAQKQ